MERIINIDIVSENALFDKYNKVKVNKDLINYLLREIPYFTKADNFKIRINNCCSDIDSIPVIVDGLKQEYDEGDFRYDKNNFIQIIYFLLGVFILYLSSHTTKPTAIISRCERFIRPSSINFPFSCLPSQVISISNKP